MDLNRSAQPNPPQELPYVKGLDGLRCLAVAAVIFHHTRPVIGESIPLPRGGFLGVDVFFVVSGFLITALLLVENERHGSISLVGFYWRRAVRLLPALLPVLAVYLAFHVAQGTLGRDEVGAMVSALGFVINWWWLWIGTDRPGIVHLWSLAVEEQFYLVWPAMVIFVIRGRKFAVSASIIGSLIVGSALWRMIVWSQTAPDDWLLVYIRTDVRVDQLLIGALLALMWFHHKLPSRTAALGWPALAFLAVTMIVAIPQAGYLYNGLFTLVAVATALAIAASMDSNWTGNQLLTQSPFRAIGRVSYGLYLWHVPIFWIVRTEAGHLPLTVRLLILSVTTAAATTLSWRWLEKPALRYKHRFGRSSTTPNLASQPESGTGPSRDLIMGN